MGRIIGLLFIAALIYYLVNGIRYLIAKKILKNNITNLIKILKKIKITLSPKASVASNCWHELGKTRNDSPSEESAFKTDFTRQPNSTTQLKLTNPIYFL